MIVGMSISSSPDLPALGFGPEHLRAAMVAVAQHLLVAGHQLAYGGDLRPGGFTQDLLKLLQAYTPRALSSDDGPSDGPRVRNYLAWPIYLHTSVNDEADVATVAQLVRTDPPVEASDGETVFTKARGLNEMRARMTADIDARVVIGGKTSGFSGLLPGIAEEVLLMLEARKPVYLCGAFGGCTQLLIEAIRGGSLPRELSPTTGELVDTYATRAPAQPNFDRLRDVLADHGLSRLSETNGLSEAENDLLFTSPDHMLLVALILKGLARRNGLAPRKPS